MTVLNQSAAMATLTLRVISTDYDKHPKAKPTDAERRHFCQHEYYFSYYTTSLTSLSLTFSFLKITSLLPQVALKALRC